MNQQEPDVENTQVLLALHKLYAEMANAVSQRRENTNKFFLTLITTLFTLQLLPLRDNQEMSPCLTMFFLLVVLAVAYIWRSNLHAYQKLNKAKYEVIMEIESKLSYAGFTREWKLLKADGYQALTDIEVKIPIIAVLIQIGFTIYQLMGN